jgi:hypothetical protein
MVLFNAFQIVVLFACMPLIINYLDTATFVGHAVAYYAAWVIYFLLFIFQVAWSANGLENINKNL